jgi:hypothetical protein
LASTYSPLKIELIGTGDQSGTWGVTTNTNLGTAIEEAITGSADVAFSSADVTLTLTNTNTTQVARNLRLNLTGTSGGARNLTVPNIEKFYIVANGLADDVTVKNSTGTTYTVPAGTTGQVFSTGTGIKAGSSFFEGELLSSAAFILGGAIENTPIGSVTKNTGGFTNVTATGTLQVDGNTTLGNASGDTITANAGTLNIPNNLVFNSTGSVTLPNGTTAEQPVPPTVGMIRYNSSTDSFEGYTTAKGWGAIGGGNATNIGFWQNIQIITGNQVIDSGYNASSVGPITIASGSSVDVPAGSVWLVL